MPLAGSAESFRVTSTPGSDRRRARVGTAGRGDAINMEFIQFPPTGMVWPPVSRWVTEGVRGDGGVLKNSGRTLNCANFDFHSLSVIPKDQYAETEGRGRPVA